MAAFTSAARPNAEGGGEAGYRVADALHRSRRELGVSVVAHEVGQVRLGERHGASAAPANGDVVAAWALGAVEHEARAGGLLHAPERTTAVLW